jgi:four helix bundle protein
VFVKDTFKMKEIKSVKDLDVFKLSHEVALEVYKLTLIFPKEEVYGLVSQLRRCCVSINSNLVEGAGRSSSGEFKQFVGIARGSASELEYQIEISKDLGYVKEDKAKELKFKIERIIMMLSKLLKSLK